MKRKKIMMLTADPKTLMCHRSELLERWSRLGCEVVALANGPNPAVSAYLKSINGRYIPISFDRSSLNPLSDVKMYRSLRHHMEEEQPDAVFAYTLKSVSYGALAARAAKVAEFYPLICGLGFSFGSGGGWKRQLAGWGTRRLLSAALRRSDHVFFQNEDDQAQMREEGVMPSYIASTVLPGSGVDVTKFRHTPLDLSSVESGVVRFLYVSRILKSKGAADFAAAAQILRRQHPYWEFHMVGSADPGPDGVPEAQIRSWVQAGDVQWHGETANVIPHLQSAHAVVLPSTYREGVPRCLLEAMAIGRPIITTDAIGCRKTVRLTPQGEQQRLAKAPLREGINGVLIEPGSKEALTNALAEVGACGPINLQAMANASRNRAVEHFRVELVIDRTCDAMLLLRGSVEHDEPWDFAEMTRHAVSAAISV